ncbi:MAG: NAD(P)/FAD-dependent oxidoreductase [Rhodospirillaceae bacterium]|nr:NAD(P)/FAD-dependent oxidoreductase [Rhodospirillaceae bacterium]
MTRTRLSRRTVLAGTGALAVAGTAGALGLPTLGWAQDGGGAHIVIVGGGAAGLTMASRLSHALSNVRITLVGPETQHRYQPGFTLVAAGLWQPPDVLSATERYLPAGIDWRQTTAAGFDPEANRVDLADGTSVDYDVLVVATGLDLRYDLIEGMDASLIGQHGLASVYASPEAALATAGAIDRFVESGGVGIFTRPPGDMKCAGAPLKMTFVVDDHLRTAGRRGAAELIYNAHDGSLFSVPLIHDRVVELYAERGIAANYHHVLAAVDPGARRATFQTEDGLVEMDYDLLHVVPPMAAPAAVANSALAWQEGGFAAQGWVEANRDTLQHPRYANVFTVGDVAGVPKGKTAASVKAQSPVATANIVDFLAERELSASYNGYTSCPMITAIGTALLIEFDYENRVIPTFPTIDPFSESWAAWVIEDQMLRPLYYTMLRGYA